jgi:hypothetical protein
VARVVTDESGGAQDAHWQESVAKATAVKAEAGVEYVALVKPTSGARG